MKTIWQHLEDGTEPEAGHLSTRQADYSFAILPNNTIEVYLNTLTSQDRQSVAEQLNNGRTLVLQDVEYAVIGETQRIEQGAMSSSREISIVLQPLRTV